MTILDKEGKLRMFQVSEISHAFMDDDGNVTVYFKRSGLIEIFPCSPDIAASFIHEIDTASKEPLLKFMDDVMPPVMELLERTNKRPEPTPLQYHCSECKNLAQAEQVYEIEKEDEHKGMTFYEFIHIKCGTRVYPLASNRRRIVR